MNLTRTLIVTATLFASTLAFAAGSYEVESKKVEAAIAASKTPGSTDDARKMLAESQRMMKEGKEAEAMKLLEDVKKLLKMN